MGNNRTPLYDCHVKMKGKIVDFSGWDMPIHYGSQLNEHLQVRKDAGMFDVSHMTILDITGPDAKQFLQKLFANDVGRLKSAGKALYSCMLNENGGVIDDLITYYMSDDFYRTVVNAGTRDKDIAWITQQAKPFNVTVVEKRELAMIAVQGPNARKISAALLPEPVRQTSLELKPFSALAHKDYFIARTGYTGEDGFEIMLPKEDAVNLWNALYEAGVAPIGLGARDTLRLEAGMNLYGTDMDESVTPLECGLGWTVAWEPASRDFIGRAAIEAKKENSNTRFVGIILESRGVIRNHQKVFINGTEAGEVTSGTFSPTLKQSIAMARISAGKEKTCSIEIRNKQVPAKIIRPVFARNGKACIQDI